MHLELDNFHTVGLIAEELAKWHSLDFPAGHNPVLWETLRKFATNGIIYGFVCFPPAERSHYFLLAPKSYSDPQKAKTFKGVDVEKLKLEVLTLCITLSNHIKFIQIDELEKILAKLNSPIVFCHNDLLHKNIIKSANTGRIGTSPLRCVYSP